MKPASAQLRATNLIAITCALGGTAGFVLHDVLIKSLSSGYALHQITFIRGIVAGLVTLAVLIPLEGGYRNLVTPFWRIHIVRGFLVVAANMAFYSALASLPIGEATAIYFIAPLVITALSAVVLGEHVGPRRWSAVFIGLAGVVLVVQPGMATFQMASLLPAIAAICYGVLQILTRVLGVKEKASTMSFYMQFTFMVFSGTVGLFFGNGWLSGSADPSIAFLTRAWIWPPSGDWPVLLGIGLIAAFSAYMLAQAYRLAEGGLIAPFEYVGMVMAIIFSIAVFGDWPNGLAWAGIFLIGASGLYVFFRETILGRKTDGKAPRPSV